MSPYAPTFTTTPLVDVIDLDDLLLLINRYMLALRSFVVFCTSFSARVQLLALCVFFLVAVVCTVYFPRFIRNCFTRKVGTSAPARTFSAFRALSNIIIPATSLWPSRYLNFIDTNHRKRIAIPLRTLVDEVLAGKLEFRNTAEDLSLLIGGGAFVDGWEVVLEAGWPEQCEVRKWILCSWITTTTRTLREAPYNPPTLQLRKISLMEQDVIFSVCSPYLRLMSTDKPLHAFHEHFTTASVPCFPDKHMLEGYLSTVLDCFRCGSTPMAALLVTTANINVKTDGIASSKELALVSLPFMQRTSHCENTFTPTTPSLADFLSVLRSARMSRLALSDSEYSIRVHSAHNVSSQFINLLTAYGERLEYDDKTRDDCLRRLGLRGWREERLCSAWEAAAMKIGKIEKWVIVLERL